MGDHQTCHVKFQIIQKQSFAIKLVLPDIGVVHNNNSYVSEEIVLKHTSAKFDLIIYKTNQIENIHCSGYILAGFTRHF